MPQKVNLGLNNLAKWKEMNCLNERIMSIPLALMKFYFVQSIVCVSENSLTYIKGCHWTKQIPELKSEGKNVLVKDERWKICPSSLPHVIPTQQHKVVTQSIAPCLHRWAGISMKWLMFQVLCHTWRSPQHHGFKQKMGMEIPVAILSHLIFLLSQERNALLSHTMLICALYAWSWVAPTSSYKS